MSRRHARPRHRREHRRVLRKAAAMLRRERDAEFSANVMPGGPDAGRVTDPYALAFISEIDAWLRRARRTLRRI